VLVGCWGVRGGQRGPLGCHHLDGPLAWMASFDVASTICDGPLRRQRVSLATTGGSGGVMGGVVHYGGVMGVSVVCHGCIMGCIIKGVAGMY
jgi:hypothetical protein